MAKQTGLKLQQVYKWYWDTEKKNEQLQKEIKENDPEISSPMRISRKILKTQYTDEFGGYSKTWFTDGLKEMRNNKNNIDELEEENQGDFGMDYLARSLGLDIEALAIKLATEDDDSNIKPITETIPQ